MPTRTITNTTDTTETTDTGTSINLSKVMPRTLEQCEADVEAGLRSFVKAGRALDEIKTGELYKDRYGMGATWEKYCKTRWNMSKPQADRLSKSARVFAVLEDSKRVPIGILPETESVTRPLNQLPSRMVPEAWNAAVQRAGSNRPTANDVQYAVDQIKEAQDKTRDEAAKIKRYEADKKKTQPQSSAPYQEFAEQASAVVLVIIQQTREESSKAKEADQKWFDEIIKNLKRAKELIGAAIPTQA